MFDKEFYPTPKHLIRKMLEPYYKSGRFEEGHLSLDKKEILEPQAGKADICDYIKENCGRYSTPKISCIELNPDLQAILREKGYPVIAGDFLTYHENYFWDLIIMNPPFSNGDEHLLHAISLARNTDIVCLLNANTIRNPHTQKRKQLIGIIEDLGGSLEFIKDEFSDAERKTNVEIVIVRLTTKDSEETFDYDFDKEKMPNLDFDFDVENDAIARVDLVGNMNIQYKIVMETYKKQLKEKSRHDFYMSNMTSIDDSYYKHMYLEKGTDKQCYNHLSKSLKVFMWRQVIDELDVKKYMSSKVIKNFEAFIAQQSEVAFTKENVASFFQMIMNNRVNIWEEAIVDVFDVLTRYDIDNRHNVEGWRTNDRYKISRKIILPYWVEWQGSYDTNEYMKSTGKPFQLKHQRNKEYTDIDKVLSYIQGHALPEWSTIDFNLEKHFNELGRIHIGDKYNNNVSSGYFNIKFFKKGTVHITFKDKKLWDEFNMRACAGKGWLPGSEKREWEEELKRRKKARDKAKEEAKVESQIKIGKPLVPKLSDLFT